MSAEANIVTLTDHDAEARRARLRVNQQSEDLNNEAVRLRKAGQFHTACVAIHRAVNLSPESGFLRNGLASVLWNLGRYAEALEQSWEAERLLDEGDLSWLVNMGLILSSMGRRSEAHHCLRRAHEAAPDDAHTRWSYAISLLDHGEWEEGLRQYEGRADFRGRQYYPQMPFPLWRGESLAGKTLYVQSEQGVGDRILMSRYLAWIKETWPTSRVLFLARSPDLPDLTPLLWGYHQRYGVEFLHPDTPWPQADFGCFLMSLPYLHGSRPDHVPADPGLIRQLVQPQADQINMPEPRSPAIRVGISWTGNTAMTRNVDRTIPPELLFELEADPSVQLLSLQFRDDAVGRLDAGQLVFDAAREVGERGLKGTASVMMNLDLMITCCTANAHLAGALGIPTWVLLCHDPYWVWLRGREDSVWYPSVRLYRQDAPGDWRGVLDRVRMDLGKFARAKLSGHRKERLHG
jgi:Tfp pilus assembly protein PilF